MIFAANAETRFRSVMTARFLVYHVTPAGTVNPGMTLYFDLGSKGIRILAYPWFIRVIDTNKFPYIWIWISIFESENIDSTSSGSMFRGRAFSPSRLTVDRTAAKIERCDSFHLTRGLNRFRWIYSDSLETTICSRCCSPTRSGNSTIDDLGAFEASFLLFESFFV